MNCPCRGCRERHESCHSACGKYAEWKDMKDRVKAARAEERSIDNAMLAGAVGRKDRWYRSMKKRGKTKIKN